MAWETRKGRTYYYSAEKVGGRTVKRYLGGGQLAAAIAQVDRLDRQHREEEAQIRCRERERLDRAAAQVRDLCRLADAAVALALETAGYYRHHRGEWRRKRRGLTTGSEGGAMPVEVKNGTVNELAVRAALADVPEDARERADLIDRALAGNKKLVVQAVACVRKHPGDLPLQYANAVSSIVERVAGDNPIVREALRQEVQARREELRGEDPTPLEALLVERVLACWMHAADVQRSYDTRFVNGGSTASLALWEKRLESANRQCLAAAKALAQVRRLQLPMLQVNVAAAGGQQVNQLAPVNVGAPPPHREPVG
jgi:hypothetical protein